MKSELELPSSSTKTQLWLRCETKLFERRTPLTPAAAKKLIEGGLDVAVEEDPKRIFDIEGYKKCASQFA
jgi:saccharopine dehydrogenase (NAD+, L-lysine-forming)